MKKTSLAGPLPRYNQLALAVRMCLYGRADTLVQHMAQRNHDLNDQRQLEQLSRKDAHA